MAACLALAIAPAPAQTAAPAASQPPATPFGLRMGMTLADLARFHPQADPHAGVYQIDTAPAGQPEFVNYLLLISPHQGLCKVIGTGRPMETSESGEELRDAFDRLEAVLLQKYGDGDAVDDLKAGSLWSAPEDWLRSLREHDRDYETVWRSRDLPLPPNLKTVALQAKAIRTPGIGFVSLVYEFTNFDACLQELNTQRGDAF